MDALRYDWTLSEIEQVYDQPILELVFQAATVHRQYFDPRKVQLSSLLSIKTGGCPEDCHYCPQAARYHTDIKKHKLLDVEDVVAMARNAKAQGASRMCLGAAWREVKDDANFARVLTMVQEINSLGMEVCCTLGMLGEKQAQKLKEAGLYAYNHNVDTSADFYNEGHYPRTYSDRLTTLENVRAANLTVCSGGILGLGESKEDRIAMLKTLSNLTPHPESVPINTLVPMKGTPLGDRPLVSIWGTLRMIATTRIVMPSSYVRLSAGRLGRSVQDQALCFLAGANSIFLGDKLLTSPNPEASDDLAMLNLLGLEQTQAFEHRHAHLA